MTRAQARGDFHSRSAASVRGESEPEEAEAQEEIDYRPSVEAR